MAQGTPVLPASHWATFPHDTRSVPRARHLVREVLDDAGLDEATRAEIEVVLSEIVGNAVRHARPLCRDSADGIEVACRLLPGGTCGDRHVEVSVTDGGGGPVALMQAADSDTSGRGLGLVDHLACEWGVVEDLDDFSRTVWATFGGPRRHTSA